MPRVKARKRVKDFPLTAVGNRVKNIVYNMQNLSTPTFGVSPAFVLSLIGTRLSPHAVAATLPRLRELDPERTLPLGAWEPEIFHPDDLPLWTNDAVGGLGRVADGEGFVASQFVAHFLGDALIAPAGADDHESPLAFHSLDDRLARVCDIAGTLGTSTIVVPLLPVARPTSGRETICALARTLDRLSDHAAAGGCRLAVELVPGGPVPTTRELAALQALMRSPVGYNLDTGNAAAAGETPEEAIARLGRSILGTHLCDAVGSASSRTPGEGAINWKSTVAMLRAGGYAGSWDVEIRCRPDQVREHYGRGLAVIADALAGTMGRATMHTGYEEHV